MQNQETKKEFDYNQPLFNQIQENAGKIKPVSPDNPPWNSWEALGVWLSSFIFILFLPVFFVFPYLFKMNVNFQDGVQMTDFLKNDSTAIFLQVLSIIPAHILTLVLAWIVVTKWRKYPFLDTLGWNLGGFKYWHLIPILVGFFATAAALTAIFGEQDNDFLKMLRSSNATVYAVAFMATFTAPLVEEVIYRGILYSAFQRTIGIVWAVIAVTSIFAFVHFFQYWGSPATLIMICLLSLILTLIRVKTKNLLPCFILHTVFNGLQSLFLVVQTFLPEEKTQTAGFFLFR